MTYEDFELRVLDGEVTERTLVRFPVVTGDKFVPAGELELFTAIADPRRAAFRRRLIARGLPIVTAILVGLQIRIYLWSMIPSRRAWVQEHLTNWAPAIYEGGEVWRLLSYGLLHLNLSHILLNLVFLGYTSYHIERAMGRRNLLAIFFGSTTLGGLASIFLGGFKPSLGSSGGVFGLIAAAIVLGWKHGDDLPVRARRYFGWALIPYLAMSLISGLSSDTIDNWCHLGGMLAGGALATVLQPEALEADRRPNQYWRRGLLAAGLTLFLGLALLGTRGVPLQPVYKEGWSVPQPPYWRESWTFTGDRGVSSGFGEATLGWTRVDYPTPITPEGAVAELLNRVGAAALDVVEISRSPTQLAGVPATRLSLGYRYLEKDYRLEALIVSRGIYIHWAWIASPAHLAPTYAPLVERIFGGINLPLPEELLAASQRASEFPGSPEMAVQHADALYKLGEPEKAVREYRRALAINPKHTDALLGLLRTTKDYGLPEAPAVAELVLREGGLQPEVWVAVAELYASLGDSPRAKALLDGAWARWPGDRLLRRARNKAGLSVVVEP